ncbi:MAG: NADH-quinone oxidoreductase subunit J [Nitrospiraceae bacterium]|nr:NADH-quinone oxidoreductase subunit J [Nitrospiraceae bacterium]
MENVFYISAAVAVVSTLLVIVQKNVVHALLYLILSLLAVSVIFFSAGAPFVAALEIIIYAGAIMVLFVFVIMMLNLGAQSAEEERRWQTRWMWIVPSALAAVLLADLVYMLTLGPSRGAFGFQNQVSPKQVGIALFGPYLVGVELASILLLAGLIGAYHLGRPAKKYGNVEDKTV